MAGSRRLIRSMLGAVVGLAMTTAAPSPSHAHPHVFVDAGVEFVLDDRERVQGVRITWTFDAFVSLYIVEEQGLDRDGDGVLTRQEAKTVAEKSIEWETDFDGDMFLSAGSEDLALSAPRDPTARYDGGRLSLTFHRDLKAPVPASAAPVVARIYDPTYFIAYSASERRSSVRNASGACRVDVTPFEATPALFDLQTTLAALSREETPDQQNVGALFADVVTLTCE